MRLGINSVVKLGRRLCFLFALGVALAQPPGNGVIGGIVIDASTGDPVRKAVVTLTWHGEPKSWATARTAGDGIFRFEGLPPGDYDLHAEKQGTGRAVYGADHVGELGDVIPLAKGQTRDGLKLRFVHASSISGRVVDSDGDPVSGATVTLYRPGRNLGERILVRARNAQSSDRGEYKFNNVQPGHFYLSAQTERFANNGGVRSLAMKYYGDTRDWQGSNILTARDGESLAGIDFHLSESQHVRLTGIVTGAPEPPAEEPGQTPRGIMPMMPPGVQVQLSPADETYPFLMGFGANGNDHRFDGGEWLAGRYRLEANTRVGNKTYAASQIIDLQPGIGDIELDLAPASDVKGHLRLEGGTAAQASGIQVNLARGQQRFRNQTAHPAADGSFTLDQVPPGEWELNLNPLPHGAFLKSVLLGDKDVRFQRLAIESGSDAPLNIVVSMNSAKIEGEVDPAGADAKRAGILLAPTGKFHDLARFYYAVAADADGKFKISGIAPGQYKIFALEKLAPERYRSPEAADALDALIEGGAGLEIALTEGKSLQAHPPLIPFERAREVIP